MSPAARPRGRAALLAALAVALAAGCSGAPARPETIEPGDYRYAQRYLAWMIGERMEAEKVTGLSIALVDGSEIVWAQGFGWADAARRVPATSDTLFRVGSVTKLFTAVALMQLVERGLVDLDAPLTRYLPEFSVGSRFPGAGPITVRSLLAHHSGLPSNYLAALLSDHPPPLSALPELLRDEELAFAPGRLWAYSNLGYELLGLLVERVSGESFADYQRAHLLDPLGMRQATFSQQLGELPALSKGYRSGRLGRLYPLRATPAGGLSASARELGMFVLMLLSQGEGRHGRLLSPDSLASMFERQYPDCREDFELSQGLGFALGSRKLGWAGPVVSHTGAIVYFRSALVALPERGLGVVVLSNSNDVDRADLLGELATTALRLMLETKYGLKAPELPRDEPPDEVPLSELERTRLAGDWASAIGAVRIEPHGERLRLRVMDRPLELVQHGDGTFSLRYRLLGLVSISPGPLSGMRLSFPVLDGRSLLTARYNGRWLLAGSPVVPYRLDERWRARLGRYQVEDADGDFPILSDVRLYERDGLLLFQARQNPYPDLPLSGFALRPLSPQRAVVEGESGVAQIMGMVLRAERDERGELLRFAGLKLRRVAD